MVEIGFTKAEDGAMFALWRTLTQRVTLKEIIEMTNKEVPDTMLFPLPEARRRLGDVSAASVYRWAAQGKIRLTKLGGRTFISASEIARIIDEGISGEAPKAA